MVRLYGKSVWKVQVNSILGLQIANSQKIIQVTSCLSVTNIISANYVSSNSAHSVAVKKYAELSIFRCHICSYLLTHLTL